MNGFRSKNTRLQKLLNLLIFGGYNFFETDHDKKKKLKKMGNTYSIEQLKKLYFENLTKRVREDQVCFEHGFASKRFLIVIQSLSDLLLYL